MTAHTWTDRYPRERTDDPDIDDDFRDDKPPERTNLHVVTELGDLDAFGRPLKPGS